MVSEEFNLPNSYPSRTPVFICLNDINSIDTLGTRYFQTV